MFEECYPFYISYSFRPIYCVLLDFFIIFILIQIFVVLPIVLYLKFKKKQLRPAKSFDHPTMISLSKPVFSRVTASSFHCFTLNSGERLGCFEVI